MGQAQIERLVGRQVLELLPDCQHRLPDMLAALGEQALRQLRESGGFAAIADQYLKAERTLMEKQDLPFVFDD
jgi:hypothetical protein